MKLVRDFGVRALLATILTLGLVLGAGYCLVMGDATLLKEYVSALGPFDMAALTFYFSTRSRG